MMAFLSSGTWSEGSEAEVRSMMRMFGKLLSTHTQQVLKSANRDSCLVPVIPALLEDATCERLMSDNRVFRTPALKP